MKETDSHHLDPPGRALPGTARVPGPATITPLAGVLALDRARSVAQR